MPVSEYQPPEGMDLEAQLSITLWTTYILMGVAGWGFTWAGDARLGYLGIVLGLVVAWCAAWVIVRAGIRVQDWQVRRWIGKHDDPIVRMALLVHNEFRNNP